jgi:hypothetical protein
MKFPLQTALASLTLILMSLVPAPAFASRTAGGPRAHSQTYHDRTPKVHTNGSHPRRG